ncbi:TetR family transcriptional regulator [Bordetella genomosp. 5]|uniref:TetR/AcrR family transcriptional regulator n=1 Tax=Bordetella genomosp. 5 TaxID=1395608 RepID=UPI000B9ED62E|nr:TetR/AcrR family transcriptional regulator [Bordetella genomosp. 5]OZI46348.1 TetR family transcriptional regulator [Bordetella genomosp. 5]
MTQTAAGDRKVRQTRSPGRPRSIEATEAVLDAAYRLSAAHGLRGATIQAIADDTGVSKMTIYKWWENRLHLLIDAFLRKANQALPLGPNGTAKEIICAHAELYVTELQGDLGRVQLAVLAECMAETGSTELFVSRYLSIRRERGVEVIRRGQKSGEIKSRRPPEDVYDQIYGTIFYRSQFGLAGLDSAFVKSLIEASTGE